MKIQQIGAYTGDIISTVLNNRGIKDVETFLNPSIRNYVTNVDLINNMKMGIETFLNHLNNGSKIALIVDSDVDGITSASMLYRFIQELTGGYENIVYYMHDRKTHGLTKEIMDKIKNDKIDFLVIADASTNDIQQIAELYEIGIEVLVIDHHEPEEGYQENRAILINNQLDSTNKNFVGAGMVMNFMRAIAQKLKRPIASKYMDLTALGQIADSSDISEAEIRGIVFYGLKNINNPFLQHMTKEKEIKQGECTPNDISYSIAPLINAIIRVGEMEEKEMLFKAFAGIEEEKTFFVDKKKKNAEGKFDKIVVQMNLYEYVYDMAVKLKGKQDRMVKKEVERLKETATVMGIGIGYIDESLQGLTGLIAGRMANEFGVPFLIGRDNGTIVSGSGRGYEKVLPDFKEWCTSTGQFIFVQGHGNAFGFAIDKDNLETLIEQSRENTVQCEPIYEVDLIVDEKIDHTLISTLDRYKEVFGGKVTKPIFAFTNISVNKKLISHKGTTLSFYEDKFKFVKFGIDFDMEYLETFAGDRVLVDFVGEIGYNTWNNMKQEQMIIKDFQIKEQTPKEITIENIVF